MDMNKFTAKAQEAIQQAESTATRYGHQQVDVEHLLMALLDQKEGLAISLLSRAQIDIDRLKQRVDQGLTRRPKGRVHGPDLRYRQAQPRVEPGPNRGRPAKR